MMVEHVHPAKVFEELDQAAKQIHSFSQNVANKPANPNELKKLITMLQNCNENLGAENLQEKQFAPTTQMKASIESALRAVALFNSNRPESNSAAQKSVTQAIAGLFSALREQVKKLDKNLRDIRKYRIGQHIEQTNKSKDTK